MILYRDNKCYRLDCTEGISIINKILLDYTFPNEYFFDLGEKLNFLDIVTDLYSKPFHFITTKQEWLAYEKNSELHYLMKSEKSKDEFKKFWVDPNFRFDGNKWDVTYYVLTPLGSIEKWDVSGEFFPDHQVNKILNIIIEEMKPKGSYIYPLVG